MERRRGERAGGAPAGRAPYLPARSWYPEDLQHGLRAGAEHRPPGRSRAGGGQTRGRRAAQRRWWPIITPIIVVAALMSLLFPSGRHEWALSLFHEREHYTVLSFNKAWKLPVVAVKGAPMTVSFTIGNHEGRPVRYRYVLTASGNGVSRGVKADARTLADGASWTVTTVIKPVCPSSACLIKVALPGHAQQIDFHVTLVRGHTKKHG